MLVSTDGAVQRVIVVGGSRPDDVTGRPVTHGLLRNDSNVDGGALYRAALDGSAPPARHARGVLRDNDPRCLLQR